MNEKAPDMEGGAERLPSKEEIRSVFERVFQKREFRETKFKEDENGVVEYEVEGTNFRGYPAEYNYERAKYDYKSGAIVGPEARIIASIHEIEYDRDGMPAGGKPVANYKDGAWEIKPEFSQITE